MASEWTSNPRNSEAQPERNVIELVFDSEADSVTAGVGGQNQDDLRAMSGNPQQEESVSRYAAAVGTIVLALPVLVAVGVLWGASAAEVFGALRDDAWDAWAVIAAVVLIVVLGMIVLTQTLVAVPYLILAGLVGVSFIFPAVSSPLLWLLTLAALIVVLSSLYRRTVGREF